MNPNLLFQQLFESESSTYTYLLADKKTREAIIIDCVIETVERDIKLVEELGLNLLYVMDTHIHADHITAAGELRNRLSVKTAFPASAGVACADINLKEGDVVNFGQFRIKVLETPGHTHDSLSFLCEDMVFTGDALLIRGCGRTDFQSGSSEQLYHSVTQKLFKLPVDTIVYPAHDYKGFTSSTIEMEIKHNPRLGKNNTQDQFVKIMADLKMAYPKKIDVALPANLLCGNKKA
ncbi:MAG TPA: MBL fold metallo-hydrolase [Bacteriovoracaceae bacterium]|nr:MBL fold metallo-hydrolase [Bacteriovoracaceae bacterium]